MSVQPRSMTSHVVRIIPFAVVLMLGVALPTRAVAGPILAGTWYEFGFSDVGTAATGCDPADPAGSFCVPSSSTPTEFLDAPPWTFTAGAGGASLTVTDAFLSGDRFQLFDFGTSVGLTSLPGAFVDCGDDPVPCLANADMSHGVFLFAAGSHSISVVLTAGGFGAAYFKADGDVVGTPGTQPVPEPATLLLVLTGGLLLLRSRSRSLKTRTDADREARS